MLDKEENVEPHIIIVYPVSSIQYQAGKCINSLEWAAGTLYRTM